ncbi:Histone-lysine N-methyltransferase eggless [Eumeta japonica]|uniref:Mediator of RNA polymerase II transcription subunit 29 n=1 Tax=Eumeta variegata TaxID=151549 RepID=A0A4C1TKJ2_EUMVA|nr:Histone-lysine N-methyltransferase eggless [Eumeta japonica]
MKTQQWKSISENTSEKLPKSATDSEAKTDNSPKPEIENLNQEHDADMMKRRWRLETRAKQLKVNKEQSSETIEVSNKEMTTAKVDNENNDDDILGILWSNKRQATITLKNIPSGRQEFVEIMMQPIPPVGEIERRAIQQNGIYYAVKNNPIASWRTEPFIRYTEDEETPTPQQQQQHQQQQPVEKSNDDVVLWYAKTFGRPESMMNSAQPSSFAQQQQQQQQPAVKHLNNSTIYVEDENKPKGKDKSKCSCWQLTLAGAKYGNLMLLLKKSAISIDVYWIMCQLAFMSGGQDAGDEYFAELDYIEVAEQIKEGYESDVEPPEPEEEEPYNPELDDDGDFQPSKSFLTRSKQRQNALKSTRANNQDEDSQERQVINFNPNADMNEDSVRENSKTCKQSDKVKSDNKKRLNFCYELNTICTPCHSSKWVVLEYYWPCWATKSNDAARSFTFNAVIAPATTSGPTNGTTTTVGRPIAQNPQSQQQQQHQQQQPEKIDNISKVKSLFMPMRESLLLTFRGAAFTLQLNNMADNLKRDAIMNTARFDKHLEEFTLIAIKLNCILKPLCNACSNCPRPSIICLEL